MSDSLLSLFKKEPLWANQSRLTLKKSNCEQIAFVAVYNRATLSKLLSIHLKKSDISDSLVIQANRFQKTSDSLEKNVFFICFRQFTVFLLFYAKRANPSCRSSLSRSFLKIDGINLLLLLFTKEQSCANRFCCSLQKSYLERIDPDDL